MLSSAKIFLPKLQLKEKMAYISKHVVMNGNLFDCFQECTQILELFSEKGIKDKMDKRNQKPCLWKTNLI